MIFFLIFSTSNYTQTNVMRNPVKKFMDKLHKPKTHYDASKYDRVKEKCSHWDLDWLGCDSYQHDKKEPFDKSRVKYRDGDNT